MGQMHSKQMNHRDKLKAWLICISVFQLLVVLLAILGNGMHPLLFFLQYIVWTLAAVIFLSSGAQKVAVGLPGSVIAVIVLSMTGFYANAQIAGGEFSRRPTQVSDRSIGSAFGSALTDPATFTATLFGYDCHDSFRPKCSNGIYYLGVGLAEVIFASGLAVSWIALRRTRGWHDTHA